MVELRKYQSWVRGRWHPLYTLIVSVRSYVCWIEFRPVDGRSWIQTGQRRESPERITIYACWMLT